MSALPLHEFNAKFASYRDILREEVLRFREDVYVYRQIQERKNDSLAVLNMAPAFFNIIERALFSSIIIWADKLFDEKGQRGLFDFLTFIEYNRKWLTTKQLQVRKQYPDGHWMLRDRISLTMKIIAGHRKRIRELASLESFKILRDK